MKTSIYSLESEDLRNVGAAMGLQSTSTNWIKYFPDLKSAKAFAEKDYDENDKLKWIKEGRGLRSEDLGYVMYHIQPIYTER